MEVNNKEFYFYKIKKYVGEPLPNLNNTLDIYYYKTFKIYI